MDDHGRNSDVTSDLTILRCPSCGAAEPVKAGLLESGTHVIRCRRCEETWPVRRGQGRAVEVIHPRNQSVAWSKGYTLEAVRRPLVAYGENHDPWASKIEPAAPAAAGRNTSRVWNMLTAVLALVFIGGFFGSRHIAVAAAPDLGSLFAAVGLPVNLVGLEIGNVTSKRRFTGVGVHVAVGGLVRNPSDRIMNVPELEIALLDEAGREIATSRQRTPIEALEPDQSVGFVVQIDNAPRGAAKVAVRFARDGGEPGETGAL